MPVVVRDYTSPTLVLLAFDWPSADQKNDFLGFAIERTPGFDGSPNSTAVFAPDTPNGSFQSICSGNLKLTAA